MFGDISVGTWCFGLRPHCPPSWNQGTDANWNRDRTGWDEGGIEFQIYIELYILPPKIHVCTRKQNFTLKTKRDLVMAHHTLPLHLSRKGNGISATNQWTMKTSRNLRISFANPNDKNKSL